ncbi:MAG: prepilin-type N-terminal cleavage/methylation domain-containing protein [Desulfobacterales bacterium]|nr:prepilin-type N-terminal cleavage/methylation domain-containing protein [Desulfobacterales bacterium]
MKQIKSNNGFTLIELLIAMAIASIVFAAVILSVNAQQKTNAAQSQQLQLQSILRSAMYYMTSEIRMAGYDAATILAPEPTITSFGDANEMIIQYNLNTGAATNSGVSHMIKFALNGTDLEKTEYSWDITSLSYIPSSPTILANDITDLEFEYLDNDGSAATAIGDLVMVRINITATVDNNIVYGGGSSRSLSTDVTIKNMLEF